MVSDAHQPGRLPGLDSIRGIACLMVLVVHALMVNDCGFMLLAEYRNQATFLLAYRKSLIFFAGSGVDLFFVLSGFLITGILIESLRRRDYFRNFYMRRALRILPLYYSVLFLFFVLLRPVLIQLRGYEQTAAQQGWFWAHLTNWKYSIDGEPKWWWLNHFWSLAIEEQFYFLWPLIILVTRGRRSLAQICLGIIALSPVLRQYLSSDNFSLTNPDRLTPARLDGLAFGSLLAWLVRNASIKNVVRSMRILGCLSVTIIITCYISPKNWSQALEPLHRSALSGAFTWLVLWASTWQSKEMSAPLEWIGQRSYGIYVYHFPIMCAVVLWWPYHQYLHPFQNHLAFLAVTGALTACISEVSWRFLELPALNIRRRFETNAGATISVPLLAVENGSQISSSDPSATKRDDISSVVKIDA
jgi:peptidoglycan/LPS O-acetylase OafA/YrhL